MRIVGTLSHENEAQRLKFYLTKQGIGSSFDVSFDPANGEMSYQVWIHEEDRLQEAHAIFTEFKKQPLDSRFDAPPPEPEPVSIDEEVAEEDRPPPHRFKTHLTHFLIAFCSVLFFLNTLQEIPLPKESPSEGSFLMTPIEALYMYDLPPQFEKLEESALKQELTERRVDQISPALKEEITTAVQTPYWKGFYNWIVAKIKGEDPTSGEGTLFYKIRQGEIWRLFTPCLLHKDLLHILFNMLWLWYLGKPIEERIGPFRTLLLTLVVGIGANTTQYFMSGPFFIGYSGIVTGLAGFIWMRERLAPWEGYPLNRATILFLLFFIGAIFALQIALFFLQVATTYNFSPNIGNSAHISGAIIGALLAKSPFFAQRVKL